VGIIFLTLIRGGEKRRKTLEKSGNVLPLISVSGKMERLKECPVPWR
jgi:hypothetical protein